MLYNLIFISIYAYIGSINTKYVLNKDFSIFGWNYSTNKYSTVV